MIHQTVSPPDTLFVLGLLLGVLNMGSHWLAHMFFLNLVEKQAWMSEREGVSLVSPEAIRVSGGCPETIRVSWCCPETIRVWWVP